MTNLFSRMKDVIMADLNEALNQKEKQDPIALLNQYLRQCEQETKKVGKLVERQARLKEEFTKEYALAVELAEKRQHQAEIASKAGETELFEFASNEQQLFAERASRIKEALGQAAEQLSDLERKHGDMKQKLKDMQLRRMELMGRENVARANLRINQMTESQEFTDSQPYSKFKDIENYLDRLEQKITNSFHQSTIDERIAKIEKEIQNSDQDSLNLTKE
ncbi:PspA/IM30 family protein [Neobacillus muris]|uniref:PspA/IM30 family protein n=1 Tax=Neobacillus muris TaxID=2941334 RepID=UPI002040B830|nr:PspA/IM30 family protein [Neobacillus muris]